MPPITSEASARATSVCHLQIFMHFLLVSVWSFFLLG
jgi:hypothetical protein